MQYNALIVFPPFDILIIDIIYNKLDVNSRKASDFTNIYCTSN